MAYARMFARLDRYPQLLLHEVTKRGELRLNELMSVRVYLRVARLGPRMREEKCLEEA